MHFIRRLYETANLYHNLKFDHRDTLLHTLLYAHFVWAFCKTVNDYNLPDDLFNFDEQDTSSTSDDGSQEKGTSGCKKCKGVQEGTADSRLDDTSHRNDSKAEQVIHDSNLSSDGGIR
jgi:hypothetical protein